MFLFAWLYIYEDMILMLCFFAILNLCCVWSNLISTLYDYFCNDSVIPTFIIMLWGHKWCEVFLSSNNNTLWKHDKNTNLRNAFLANYLKIQTSETLSKTHAFFLSLESSYEIIVWWAFYVFIVDNPKWISQGRICMAYPCFYDLIMHSVVVIGTPLLKK